MNSITCNHSMLSGLKQLYVKEREKSLKTKVIPEDFEQDVEGLKFGTIGKPERKVILLSEDAFAELATAYQNPYFLNGALSVAYYFVGATALALTIVGFAVPVLGCSIAAGVLFTALSIYAIWYSHSSFKANLEKDKEKIFDQIELRLRYNMTYDPDVKPLIVIVPPKAVEPVAAEVEPEPTAAAAL